MKNQESSNTRGINKWLVIGGVLIGAIALFLAFLPQILSAIGFHPHYEQGDFNLEGTRALIVATNHDTLGDPEDGVCRTTTMTR